MKTDLASAGFPSTAYSRFDHILVVLKFGLVYVHDQAQVEK